jgi:L-ascorbate metabolism protein UlaG (beta-lactamase superfamily)
MPIKEVPMAGILVVLRRSALVLLALAVSVAHAEEPEGCPGLIASAPPLILRAALAKDEVGLTFIGHSTFLIETPQGVRIATDYNDYVRMPAVPRIATMNKAHSTHFSRVPDPRIEHVLRGWNPAGGPARHDLTVGDVRVRNVSTNIRDDGGNTELDGNSIFVFETTQLCIAHLGHLHHTLTPEHLKKLGRIDVLLVPVDGGYTMQTFDMMEVLKSINAPLMLPMHYFNGSTLERFLAQARRHYAITFSDKPFLTVSRTSLPKQPTVLVLPGH